MSEVVLEQPPRQPDHSPAFALTGGRPPAGGQEEKPPMGTKPQPPPTIPPFLPGAVCLIFSGVGGAGGGVGGCIVVGPGPRPPVFTPVTASTATASVAPIASSAASVPNDPAPVVDEPKWLVAINDGQKLFAQGDLAGAQRKFREAQDSGGQAI